MAVVRRALCVVAVAVQSFLACTSAAATTATPTCTYRPGQSSGCGPDPITRTPLRTETPTPQDTPTCPPPPAAPTCAPETTYLCRDECRVDCFCATATPTPISTSTGTCTLRPSPPRTCTAGASWVCSATCRDDCTCVEHSRTPTAKGTRTHTETIVGCCQLPDSCYRPSTALRFCDRDQRGGTTYYEPYMCNRDKGRCELPVPTDTSTPTPTATPTCMNTPVCDPPYTHAWCGNFPGSRDRCDCICEGVETPTAAASPTPACPGAPTPRPCAMGATQVCGDYRCALGCECACIGDCDGNNLVSVNELIVAVNMSLTGSTDTAICGAALCRCYVGNACTERVSIDCITGAVANALSGCTAPPTATVTYGTPEPTLADRPCTSCSFAPCVVNHVRGNCVRDSASGVCFCRPNGPTPTITLGHSVPPSTLTPSMPVSSPTSTLMLSTRTPRRFPTLTTDCTGVRDSEHPRCVQRVPCGDAFCRQGLCIGECTPSRTPTPPRGTPTAMTPTPSCVPTLGSPSYCSRHCEPCPTIRAGCYAAACRDCIELPTCGPDESCVPWSLQGGNEGCCSCATPTGPARDLG